MVVAVVADDLDGRTVASENGNTEAIVHHNLVNDGNDVALLIDRGTQGLLEGLHVCIGSFAEDGGFVFHRCCRVVGRGMGVGIDGLPATRNARCRGQIDGVAVRARLDIYGNGELALRLVAEEALHGEHHPAHIALAAR